MTMLQGCHFLEVEHIGKSDIDSFYSSVEAVKVAVYGTHNIAYSLYDKYLILYPTMAADEVVLSVSSEATWNMYQNFEITKDDEVGAMGYIWKNGYQTINNANQIIEHVPALMEQFPNDAATLNHYMAQAYFLRALVHFDMCLTFGQNYNYTPDASHLGIAIVDHALSMNDKPARNTVAQVYTQVIKDLEKSLELYDKSQNNPFLPSYNASMALLARVYLHKSDWENAKKCATAVIESVGLTNREDYVRMFDAMKAPSTTEMIYALNGKQISSSSCYKMYWHKEAHSRPSERVTELIPDGDIRKEIVTFNGESVCNKFFIEDGASEGYSCLPILRCSEMYLIRAEANLMLDNTTAAARDIEALQSRAMGKEIALPTMTKEEMDVAIEEERIKELCFEGHRFWDITRRHKNLVRTADNTSSVSRLDYPDFRFVLPIPAVELEANSNMIPNPTSNE